MKFCKDCAHAKKDVINTPHGLMPLYLCESMECRDPVSGDMLPCELARREQVFCGIQAKHFVVKEVKPAAPLLEIAPK